MVLVAPYELPRCSDKLPIAACQLPIAVLSCLKLPMAAFTPCTSVALHVLIADMFIGSFYSFMCHNCNRPRASPALVSTGTGQYDICFVLPTIISCMISFGVAACSLTHSDSPYICPISCSLYCIGMTCGGPCSAPDC